MSCEHKTLKRPCPHCDHDRAMAIIDKFQRVPPSRAVSACDPNRKCRYGSCPQCDYARELDACNFTQKMEARRRAAIRLEMLREVRDRVDDAFVARRRLDRDEVRELFYRMIAEEVNKKGDH